MVEVGEPRGGCLVQRLTLQVRRNQRVEVVGLPVGFAAVDPTKMNRSTIAVAGREPIEKSSVGSGSQTHFENLSRKRPSTANRFRVQPTAGGKGDGGDDNAQLAKQDQDFGGGSSSRRANGVVARHGLPVVSVNMRHNQTCHGSGFVALPPLAVWFAIMRFNSARYAGGSFSSGSSRAKSRTVRTKPGGSIRLAWATTERGSICGMFSFFPQSAGRHARRHRRGHVGRS